MSENTPKTDKRPAPRTAFKPGQSGNPGGRPKNSPILRERCQRAVDEHVVDAWVNEVVTQGPDWVKCSELLAAYGYNKPASAKEDNEALRDARPLAGKTAAEILAAMRGES